MKSVLTAAHVLVVSALLLVLGSCKHHEKHDTKLKLLTAEKLPSQTFSINAETDTIIKGKAGTILRIYKNTFVGKDGKPAKGNIELELKEAITPGEIILAGLTTTSDGKFLETGGMIYINATAGEQPLEIANDKFIGAIIPNSKIESGMKLFEGELDSAGINWKNPKPILNDKIMAQNANLLPAAAPDSTGAVVKEGSKSEIDAVLDYVTVDTIKSGKQKAARKKGKPVKQPVLEKAEDDIFFYETTGAKGVNFFRVDPRSSYIFSVKNLGWANIDVLYDDPRTKEVEFITSIESHKDYQAVCITLIISNKSMYIPGYQRKDETFSFTHNDQELARLPVGESATILVTAYKGNKPYYAIKTIKISEKQQHEIKLEETTDDKLKDALIKGI
jgi:hypothetical protein